METANPFLDAAPPELETVAAVADGKRSNGSGTIISARPRTPMAPSQSSISPLPLPGPPRPMPVNALLGSESDDDNDDLLAATWHWTRPPRRAAFFSLKPRAVPSLVFFVATILWLYVAGGRIHLLSPAPPAVPSPPGSGGDAVMPVVTHVLSPGLQGAINAALPAAVIAAKSFWVPNPKDDFSASSWDAHSRQYGAAGVAWAAAGYLELVALHAVGPAPVVGLLALLPVAVLAIVRLSGGVRASRAALTGKIALGVAGCALGVLAFSTAVKADVSDDVRRVDDGDPISVWVLVACSVGVALRAFAWSWFEQYMTDVETDPWVLAAHITPTASAASILIWLLFDRGWLPATGHWFAGAVRTGLLSSSILLSTTFLLSHISSFSLSVLTQLVHLVFLVLYWQMLGIDLAVYGVLGLIVAIAGVRVLGVSSSSSSPTTYSTATTTSTVGDERRGQYEAI